MSSCPAVTVSPGDTTGLPRSASTERMVPGRAATMLDHSLSLTTSGAGRLSRRETSTKQPLLFTESQVTPSSLFWMDRATAL